MWCWLTSSTVLLVSILFSCHCTEKYLIHHMVFNWQKDIDHRNHLFHQHGLENSLVLMLRMKWKCCVSTAKVKVKFISVEWTYRKRKKVNLLNGKSYVCYIDIVMENSLSLTLRMSRISTLISTCTCWKKELKIVFWRIILFVFKLLLTF